MLTSSPSNAIIARDPSRGQRSAAWRAARVGRLTGSRAGAMLALLKKGGEAAARRQLRAQLVVERLTGQPQDDVYVTAALQRGIDAEPRARAAYEAATGHAVACVSFVPHPTLLAGCSPDGLMDAGGGGLLEIKCPSSTTHLEYLQTRALPEAYLPQVTHNLFITGSAWCDFVSFDDRFPEPLQLVIVRVPRDEAAMRSYELLLRMFLREVDDQVAAAWAINDEPAA
jgi:hypothetical protein